MDFHHTMEERMLDLSNLIQKLIDSEYRKGSRQEILQAGVKKPYCLVLQEASGGRSVYRTLEEMAPNRRLKALF